MAEKSLAVKHWGEIEEAFPKTRSHHLEITEPKAADCEEPSLHQPSAEHFPPKDELLDKLIPSVKPPVDRHGQNLVLHSIELQHHKRRMRLMLMAAQRQQVEMMWSVGQDFPPLPAPPSKPTKFCSSKGIVTPPTQATILARAQDQSGRSSQESDSSSFHCVELDSVSNRQLLYRAVAATCAFSGFELANESTLETLTDIADDFNTRLCKLLRSAVDSEALNGRSGFSDAMEYSLHEIGLGGIAALQKYWINSVQDYAMRLEKEDKVMIQEYHKMTDPATRTSLVKEEEKSYLSIKEEKDTTHSSTFLKPCNNGKEITDQTDFPNLSPAGIAANGNGDMNSGTLHSPHWSPNYKTEGDDAYNDDPMDPLVPSTPS